LLSFFVALLSFAAVGTGLFGPWYATKTERQSQAASFLSFSTSAVKSIGWGSAPLQR
jgi:hypothetical protein